MGKVGSALGAVGKGVGKGALGLGKLAGKGAMAAGRGVAKAYPSGGRYQGGGGIGKMRDRVHETGSRYRKSPSGSPRGAGPRRHPGVPGGRFGGHRGTGGSRGHIGRGGGMPQRGPGMPSLIGGALPGFGWGGHLPWMRQPSPPQFRVGGGGGGVMPQIGRAQVAAQQGIPSMMPSWMQQGNLPPGLGGFYGG